MNETLLVFSLDADSEQTAGYMHPSGQGDGVLIRQEDGSSRSGGKKLHVREYSSKNHKIGFGFVDKRYH